MKTIRYLKICNQVRSLLSELSATGIGNIPDLILDIRNILAEVEQELRDKEFEKE